MIAAPHARHELDPVDYLETVLAGSAQVSIPADKFPPARELPDLVVVVHYWGGPFRFRVDGPAPSATNGWPATDGDAQDLNGYEALMSQVITDFLARSL